MSRTAQERRWIRHAVQATALVFLLLGLSPVCESAWETRVVSTGGPFHAEYHAMALDQNGLPHILFPDRSVPNKRQLTYAHFDGQAWQRHTVEAGRVLECAIAVDSAGHVHIAYARTGDTDEDFDRLLRYARFDGVSWGSETLAIGGGSSGFWGISIAIDIAGHPHVGYLDAHRLEHAYHDGVGWSIEAVTGLNELWFDYAGIAVDAAGGVHLVSSDQHAPGWVHWFTNSSGTWQREYVDAGYPTSIALDLAGNPCIGYRAEPGDTEVVKLACRGDLGWNIQTIDEPGRAPKIAFDAQGNPHLSYGFRDLAAAFAFHTKYSHFDGTAWSSRILDPKFCQALTSIAVDGFGFPSITYVQGRLETSAKLILARETMPDLLGTWTGVSVNPAKGKQVLTGLLSLMNGGTGAAGRFTMRCYLSDDDQLGNDVRVGKAKKIKKLAAGGVVPVAFKLKSVAPLSGKYLIAVIDPANAIQEISEGNNILVVPIP